ncbi:hypothetical protein Mapa_000164 [Marchantia paleacea]|nr:hypothetical protein Mapa_000164 [Marchantia paleacea]
MSIFRSLAGCFSFKGSASKSSSKEVVATAAATGSKSTQIRALSLCETATLQEAIMEKVRADDLSQIADRSEKKLVVAEKESAKEVLVDKKKVVEAGATDNAENTQPNERENSATGSLEESSAVGETTTTEAVAGPASTNSRKTPFTSLSQVDADLALARALQEQERAYMLLRMGGESSDFDSSGSGSYDEEGEDDFEDDFGGQQVEEESRSQWQGSRNSDEEGTREDVDGALYDDDEAYARALQDKEDRETTAMLALAGIQVQGFHDWESAEYESESDTSQDMWQDMDPDNMSYEELVALGEAVGTQNKGLSSEAIAALPTSSYVPDKRSSSCGTEQCVICRLEYEEGDVMSTLPCKHLYHSDCIQQWLQINKVCPVCNKEVSAVNEDK